MYDNITFDLPSYSPNNIVFHNGESVSRQTNMDDRQEDVIDHIISFLSKQVQIKELISRLAPPYYPEPYPQQFYYPSTLGQFVQRSTNFSTSSFNQSSLTVPASTITISGSASTKNDKI